MKQMGQIKVQPRDFASVVIGSEIYSAKSMQGRDERKPESDRRPNFSGVCFVTFFSQTYNLVRKLNFPPLKKKMAAFISVGNQ